MEFLPYPSDPLGSGWLLAAGLIADATKMAGRKPPLFDFELVFPDRESQSNISGAAEDPLDIPHPVALGLGPNRVVLSEAQVAMTCLAVAASQNLPAAEALGRRLYATRDQFALMLLDLTTLQADHAWRADAAERIDASEQISAGPQSSDSALLDAEPHKGTGPLINAGLRAIDAAAVVCLALPMLSDNGSLLLRVAPTASSPLFTQLAHALPVATCFDEQSGVFAAGPLAPVLFAQATKLVRSSPVTAGEQCSHEWDHVQLAAELHAGPDAPVRVFGVGEWACPAALLGEALGAFWVALPGEAAAGWRLRAELLKLASSPFLIQVPQQSLQDFEERPPAGSWGERDGQQRVADPVALLRGQPPVLVNARRSLVATTALTNDNAMEQISIEIGLDASGDSVISCSVDADFDGLLFHATHHILAEPAPSAPDSVLSRNVRVLAAAHDGPRVVAVRVSYSNGTFAQGQYLLEAAGPW